MKIILTVFLKEIKDAIRDRRTLLTSVFLPAIVIPLMIIGISNLNTKNKPKFKISVINIPTFLNDELLKKEITLIKSTDKDLSLQLIKNGESDGLIIFNSNKLSLFYKTESSNIIDEIEPIINKFQQRIVVGKLKKLIIEPEILNPIDVSYFNVSIKDEFINTFLKNMLPSIIVLFSFIGCMYPAIELITGEKEKKTIETLLTVSANRTKLLFGKLLAISVLGFLASLMTIIGIFISLYFLPMYTINSGYEFLTFKFVTTLIFIVYPLNLFFSAFLTIILLFAKSFKEAQSIATPFSFIILIPVIISTYLQYKLTFFTSAIPILNLTLIIQDLIQNSLNYTMYFFSILTFLIYAIIISIICGKLFYRDDLVLN